MADPISDTLEREYPMTDPVALAREATERARYHMECSFGYGNTEKMESDPDAHLYSRIATYLETLSAPGEDEEKLCRDKIASVVMGVRGWRSSNTIYSRVGLAYKIADAALPVMREYARRLRPQQEVTEVELGKLRRILHDLRNFITRFTDANVRSVNALCRADEGIAIIESALASTTKPKSEVELAAGLGCESLK